MSQPADPELLFGKLVLHYKLTSRDEVQAALRLRAQEGALRGLGEILVERGSLTQAHAEKLRQVQREMAERNRRQQASAATGSEPAVPPSADEVPPPSGPSPTPPAPTRRPSPGTPTAAPELERELDRLLHRAVSRGASDIHVHAGAPLAMRIGGSLEPLGDAPLTPDQTERLLAGILSDEQRALLDGSGQVDFAYTLEGVGRFRANAYRQQRGTDAVFRAIPPRPPSLADLGLPESLERLTGYHQGMVLVTGPSGCGKSTTMAALVDLINRSRPNHIITVEDPIEYLHPSRRCLVNQRQVGRHTESFARALRAALREDPDIIVIGELRDLETISLALTAAETGHLVLATLHTANAIRTINRLIGVFPSDQQAQIRTMVSESLRAVVSQRLVNRADGAGRVPVLEIMLATKAVGNLIREQKTFQIRSILQTGVREGMCSLDASLARLLEAGTIAREEALRNAEEKARFGGTPEPDDAAQTPTGVA